MESINLPGQTHWYTETYLPHTFNFPNSFAPRKSLFTNLWKNQTKAHKTVITSYYINEIDFMYCAYFMLILF